MGVIRGLFLSKLRAITLCLMAISSNSFAAEKIIIDTDMAADVDDVGAVAVANYFMGTGQAELLAVMISNVGSQGGWAAAASDAVNTYYRHPDVLLGTNRGPATAVAGAGSEFTRLIGSNASRYGHDHSQFNAAEDAISVYRRILNRQPDNSVNLVVVGWMSNIANLMNSGSNHNGDGIFSSGRQLLEKKLKRLIVMGGQYPSGTEFNFRFDGPSAAHVVSNLQVPMIFTGYELGTLVQTGQSLVNTPADNPVREAYRLYGGGVEPFNRSSWDLTAVLYVVEGLGDFFRLSVPGRNQVNSDGSNSWISGNSKGDYYLVLKDSQARYRLQDRLNKILQAAPASKPQCNLSVKLSTSNPSCSVSNGSINSSISGGSAPFQFAWSNGTSGQNAGALSAGNYSLTVTDSNGCSASQSVSLESLSMLADIQHASDTQLGQVSLSLSGGRAPITFSWSNGSTQKEITDLAAGRYTVAVSDAAGCVLEKELVVQQVFSSPEHFLEAECAVNTGSHWHEQTDSNASGQLLMTTSVGDLNFGPSGSNASILRYELNLDSSGDYSLYGHLQAVDTGQDSLWYRINNNDWVAWHTGEAATLQWLKLATPLAFKSGTNVIEIAFREGGLKLDKLYITQGTQQPAGVGGESSNCGVSACPLAGSACDDGNPLTFDDRADGSCGCAGTPPSDQGEAASYDAECAVDIGSNWQAFSHSDAAKGRAIGVAAGVYNLVPSSSAESQLSFHIELEQAAALNLFARVSAPDTSSDSVWFRLNDGAWQLWHLGHSEGYKWRRWWVDLNLQAGSNVIVFAFREGGLALDKITLSNSSDLPSGHGQESSNCGTSTLTSLVPLEAECADDQGFQWLEGNSSQASENNFVAVPLGNYNTLNNGGAETELIFPFDVSQAGDYYLNTHTLTPDTSSDSLWFQLDTGAWNTWHMSIEQQFNWQRYYKAFSLSAGSHTLRIAYREGGLQLDKLVFSDEISSLEGTGPLATNCQ